ncbi:enolase C-terminal domain-like protein [Streptomyces sp. NPDC051561]|uniref:enolase C-terminal domain-like protein n=1 Tax=Streptomyces sp. NPDC051561 TaxID=3365658 RepID=UPI0037AC2BE5
MQTSVDAVIDKVSVVRLTDQQAGRYADGDSRYAVVVEAGGVSGSFGPVDELPAALIATGWGQAARGLPVADHDQLAGVLLQRLGTHSAGLGRWALGALDCAVWDLHGRLADLPVAALLTRTPADRVPVYASWLSLDLASVGASAAVRRTADEEYAFTKWSLGAQDAQQVADQVMRARDWAGEPVALDAKGSWDGELAGKVGSLLPEDAVHWVEDPLADTDRAAYTALMSSSALPVAYGERVPHTGAARDLLHHCPPLAFTFDVVWCGGITQARTWMRMAAERGVPVHLHGRAFVPAVQLAAAYPRAAGAVEYQVVWEPRRQRALTATLSPSGGAVAVPQRPGLGVEVRR